MVLQSCSSHKYDKLHHLLPGSVIQHQCYTVLKSMIGEAGAGTIHDYTRRSQVKPKERQLCGKFAGPGRCGVPDVGRRRSQGTEIGICGLSGKQSTRRPNKTINKQQANAHFKFLVGFKISSLSSPNQISTVRPPSLQRTTAIFAIASLSLEAWIQIAVTSKLNGRDEISPILQCASIPSMLWRRKSGTYNKSEILAREG